MADAQHAEATTTRFMSRHETPMPLQQNMFTGKLEDNRSDTQRRVDKERAQPQQPLMFSQRDIAQFGVNPRPQLSLPDTATLMLMYEDPRTEEEKERDLQHAAEALTLKLFPDTLVFDDSLPTASSVEPPLLEDVPEAPPEPEDELRAARLAVYLRLVALGEVGDRGGKQGDVGFLTNVALTVLDAQRYGLQREEIQAAIQIGEYRGRHVTREAAPLNVVQGEVSEEFALDESESILPETQTPSKLACYLELVQLVEEQVATLWIDPLYRHAYTQQIALGLLAARHAGLTEAEITAALHIGRQRGQRKPFPDITHIADNSASIVPKTVHSQAEEIRYSEFSEYPRVRQRKIEGYRSKNRQYVVYQRLVG